MKGERPASGEFTARPGNDLQELWMRTRRGRFATADSAGLPDAGKEFFEVAPLHVNSYTTGRCEIFSLFGASLTQVLSPVGERADRP